MFDKFNNWYDNIVEPNRFLMFMCYIIICYGSLLAPYFALNIVGVILFIPLFAVAVSRAVRMWK